MSLPETTAEKKKNQNNSSVELDCVLPRAHEKSPSEA